MERLDAGLVARISAAVSSPWSNMGALQADAAQYVGRLRSGGLSLEHALVQLRGVCRPSLQSGLVGPNSAWVHVVLARTVCWTVRTYCGDGRWTSEVPVPHGARAEQRTFVGRRS
jgi:hypothetical protein